MFVGTVAGDHHRRALVALADDLEQQVRAVLVDRKVSHAVKQSRGLCGPFFFTSASFAVHARIYAAGNTLKIQRRNSGDDHSDWGRAAIRKDGRKALEIGLRSRRKHCSTVKQKLFPAS